ncbi:MAG: NifU family protein [Actinomycetota bacterium]
MESLDDLLQRLEDLVAEMEQLDEPLRDRVFELLDGIDTIHRLALDRLAEALGTERLEEIRAADPAIRWLLDAYGAGIDQRSAAEAALDSIRPYIHSHGGEVQVIDVSAGVVRVKLSGSCSGCTASAVTLQNGVEEALREHLSGFVAMEVEAEQSPSHPPPGPTLIQIQARPPGAETGSRSSP